MNSTPDQTIVDSSITVYPGLPLVFPTILSSYPSLVVKQLKQLGVADIAIDIAKAKQA